MIEVTVRTLPVSPNRLLRMPWQRRSRLKKVVLNEIWALTVEAEKPKPEGLRFRVEAEIWWPHRRLDPDNLVASLKLHIDCLRTLGLIWRDSPNWLELPPPVQRVDRKDPRATFRIAPIYPNEGGAS